jgi:PAS domain S-box-containing protein
LIGRRDISRWYIAAFVFLCISSPLFGEAATSLPAKNVLILYSFTAREALNDFEPLKTTIRALVPGPVNFHVEYLESLRFGMPGYQNGLADSLTASYRGQKIDAVLTAFYPALRFAVDHRDRIFPGTPIIFFSVLPKRLEGQHLWPGVTGVTIADSIPSTLDLALRLQPDTRNIALVTGTSPFEHFWLEVSHQELVRRESALREIDLVGLPSQQLLNKVATLPSHTIVLFEAVPQESAQLAIGTYETLTAIAKLLPVYCIQSYCLGHGAVGGSYSEFSEQAKRAGEIAARVMAGEKAETIPVVMGGGVATAHVDWRQLQHWKMTEAVLPPGSIVLYREPSFFWHRVQLTLLDRILLAIVAAILMLFLTEILLYSREIRKYKNRLSEGETRFQLTANALPFLVWTTERDGRLTYLNKTGIDFTACESTPDQGESWVGSIYADDLAAFQQTESEASEKESGFSREYRLRRADGEYRWMLDVAAPRLNEDGSFAGHIGSASDITDQKLAQEALRNVGGRLIEAQEKERSRIARELHDDICQKLALLSMELEMSKRGCHSSGSSMEIRIEEMRQHCSGIANDVQALSHELHSSRLDYLGLTVALQSFCQEITQQHSVNVDFRCENVPDSLPKDIALSLFRIAQEGLHNSLKYSGVDRFSMKLHGGDGRIHLEINDSGVGFNVEAAKGSRGLGLISMQERAYLVNGSFSLESKEGRGTRILVSVPVPVSANDAQNPIVDVVYS